MSVNVRLETIIRSLQLRPDHHVLEVGCGHGVAADLICQRLVTGSYWGLDRSAKMVAAATRKNAAAIRTGKARFDIGEFEQFEPGAKRFDVILAIRVGGFHQHPEASQARVQPWLRPGGRIVSVFDRPLPDRSQRPGCPPQIWAK